MGLLFIPPESEASCLGQGWGIVRRERPHLDELDTVVSGGALDAEEGWPNASSLEGLAHVLTFLLFQV